MNNIGFFRTEFGSSTHDAFWESMGFPAHRPDHQELVPQFCLQRGKQQPELPSQDRRTSGPCNVYSPFHLVIDWVGIRRTFFDTLEDLDFAEGLELLFHANQHMQEKIFRPGKFGEQAGLQISERETEAMTLNVNVRVPVLFNGQAI